MFMWTLNDDIFFGLFKVAENAQVGQVQALPLEARQLLPTR